MWTTGWNKNNGLVLYGNLVFNFVPPCSLRNRLICVLIPPFNTDNFSITILAKIQSSVRISTFIKDKSERRKRRRPNPFFIPTFSSMDDSEYRESVV